MRHTTILLAALMGGVTAAAAQEPDSGPRPLIQYPMTEGRGGRLRNAVGAGHAGSIAATAWAESARRAALLLDGRKTFVTVSDGEALALPGSFSVDLWMWPDDQVTRGVLGLAVKQ